MESLIMKQNLTRLSLVYCQIFHLRNISIHQKQTRPFILHTIFPQPLCLIQNVSYGYKDEQ